VAIRRRAALVAFDAASRIPSRRCSQNSFGSLQCHRNCERAQSSRGRQNEASLSHWAWIPKFRFVAAVATLQSTLWQTRPSLQAEKSHQSTASSQQLKSSLSTLWPLRRAPRLVEALSTQVTASVGSVYPGLPGADTRSNTDVRGPRSGENTMKSKPFSHVCILKQGVARTLLALSRRTLRHWHTGSPCP
jgi:hypothetical protein